MKILNSFLTADFRNNMYLWHVYILLCNSLPSLFVAAILSASVCLIISWIWKWFCGKVKVNCWFCSNDFVVRYRLRNCWFCPSCQQYNGFTQDGDYNCTVPNMYDEHLNKNPVAFRTSNDSVFTQPAILCVRCSQNQLLMVKQLSQFEPIKKENFDEEVKLYKAKLEKLYRLCMYCRKAADRHIKMQDTILRGSMISEKQRLNLKVNSCGNTQLTKECESNVQTVGHHNHCVCIVLWFFICLLSVVNVCFSIVSSLSSACISTLWLAPIKVVFEQKDFMGSVVVSGLSCCIASVSNHQKCSKLFMISTSLWLLQSVAMVIYPIDELFPSCVKATSSSNTTTIEIGHNSELKQIVLGSVYHIYGKYIFTGCCFSILFTSFFSLVSCIKSANVLPFYSKKTSHQIQDHKNGENHLQNNWLSKCDSEEYSNSRIPSGEECKDFVSEKQELFTNNAKFANASEINGSFNALNLQDSIKQLGCNYKQKSNGDNASYANVLPSTLHTPPPSRSSSSLSLSSHPSAPGCGNAFSASPFTSSSDFLHPNNILPFTRYGAKTVVETNNKIWSNCSRSVVSYPVMSRQKSFKLGSSKLQSKPLISPAKLFWQSSLQKKSNYRDTDVKSPHALNVLPGESTPCNWDQKSDVDVSFFDSISQTGERNKFDLSDDENDSLCQPLQQSGCGDNIRGNSSPKSVVSNISNITLESLEKVEKSRLCRWILILCLVVNFILVILLVMEVKEMRDLQHWKSKATL